jgi:serine/threonine-protein kinase
MSGVLGGATRYLVHHLLGQGGMGAVHLGTVVTPAGRRRVAIKRVLAGRADDAQERMVAEAQLVFQLTHGNICQVLDLAVSEAGTFIVMEYVDGCDLKALIRAGTGLEVANVVYVAKEVAKALDYAHRRKDDAGHALWLVHGDVKPQNILLSCEGEVKLADFGIARALGRGPGDRIIGGTPGFIAPEVLDGSADQRADVFSLGVTLYVALMGRSPSSEGGLDLHALRDQHGDELASLIERATAARRDDRFATAGELERALSSLHARRFPQFTPAQLGELVQTSRSQPAADPTPEVELVSLTGTATFLTPMVIEQAGAASAVRGTRKVRGRKRRALRGWWIGLGLAGMGAIFVGARLELGKRLPPARSSPAPPASIPAPPGAAELSAPPPIAPAPVAPPALVTAKTPAKSRVRARPSARPSQAPESSAMGYITINIEPWGAVYIDGRKFADSPPVYRAPISAGVHRVKVYSAERKAYSPEHVVTIPQNETRVVGFEW